jgi:hypothetical protein
VCRARSSWWRAVQLVPYAVQRGRVVIGGQFGTRPGQAHDECVAHRLVVAGQERFDQLGQPFGVRSLYGVWVSPVMNGSAPRCRRSASDSGSVTQPP